ADVEDQARGALDAVHIVVEVHAALEAVPGIARETVAAGTTHDGVWPEKRRFEKDLARRRVCLGALAAHDAAEADHPTVVSDADDARIDLHGLLVQEQHLLALAPPPHVDRTFELVQVVD